MNKAPVDTIIVVLRLQFLFFLMLAKRQRTEEKLEITVFESNQPSQNESPMMTQSSMQPVRIQGELDDPEIDLTDGPVTVRVDNTTRQFYITNYKKVNCYFITVDLHIDFIILKSGSAVNFFLRFKIPIMKKI